jgi:hypothetical protein
MRCVFFLQTSNLHPNKQRYKSEKETLYFYHLKKKQKTHKNIKNKSSKRKLKHEPNIVEITHLCIMHKVHTRIYIYITSRLRTIFFL